MRKKRILYFVEAFGGGVFTYIVNLANGLCDDFDVYVAYGVRKQTPKNFEKYFNNKVHLIHVENYQREISFKKDLAALHEMKKITARVQPDVIHLNSSKAGILGRWLFRKSRLPIFYTPHGYSFLMTNISKKKKFFYKGLEKFFAFKNIETIACSKGEYEITKELTSNCTYVDNGVNLDEFKGIIPKKSNNKNLKIATLGRISIQKNPKVFNTIARAFPNNQFIWIGDGELRNELTAPNIKVTGWVNNKTALNYLADTDIFILTSLWEGLSMALLEAMYMKKICIVSDVVGNRDVIHDEQNGYICDSVNDFIKKVKSISTDRLMLPELIKKAHDDVVNHYNSTVMANEYKKIYTIK